MKRKFFSALVERPRSALIFVYVLVFQYSFSLQAHAQQGKELGQEVFRPVQKVMDAIVQFITGPFGRSVAILAVIGLGFLAFAGRLSWFMAGAVIIGIGLVFGAEGIVNQLSALVK